MRSRHVPVLHVMYGGRIGFGSIFTVCNDGPQQHRKPYIVEIRNLKIFDFKRVSLSRQESCLRAQIPQCWHAERTNPIPMKQIGACFWKDVSCTDGLLTYGYASWKNDSSRACHHRSQACHHLPFTCKQVACYGSHLLSMKGYAIFLLQSVQDGIDVRRWVRTHCVFTICIHRLMQKPIQPNGGDPIETGHHPYINFSK